MLFHIFLLILITGITAIRYQIVCTDGIQVLFFNIRGTDSDQFGFAGFDPSELAVLGSDAQINLFFNDCKFCDFKLFAFCNSE